MLKMNALIFTTLFISTTVSAFECPPTLLVDGASSALNRFYKERIWGPLYNYTVYSAETAFVYNQQKWSITVAGIQTDNDDAAISTAKSIVQNISHLEKSGLSCQYVDLEGITVNVSSVSAA